MYETFYGLRERPFSLLPDPDYLYLSPKHLRALTLLEYGMMNQAGFSVICGDTGAGKTTLIRRLLTDLGEDTTVGLITNTHKSFGELLSWVLMAFGIDSENKSKAQMHHLLIEYLIDQYAQNRRTVLIVDEAQNMTADTLEELRMLSNINADKDQVLQVILAGQPALRDTLRKPELMQFAQRIAVDYYLESLNREETCEYIQHRLEVAGGNPNTFTEEACHAIYRYSGGTPRLINLLCDTTLVYGFAEQTLIIDAPLVEDVVREQHKNSIVPTFNKPLAGDEPREEPKVQKKPERVSKPVTESQDNQVIQDQVLAQEQPVAALAQKAASDYTSTINVGHAEVQSKPIVKEPASVSNANHLHESTSPSEDTHSSNKVTRIKKSPATNSRTDNTADSASEMKQAATQNKSGSQTQSKPATTQQSEPAPEAVSSEPFESRKSGEDNYKEVYPIVHIADEPRKNFNIMILGFAGGVLLTAIIMVAMMWMLLRNEPPPAAAVTPPPPAAATVPPAISAEEQARIAAMERERDEALAEAEALKHERDAAVITAQKQEAMRAAEKRASEIIAEQERRYSQEMELVRQRALEAEVAAAKARERERIANDAAERARQEAARNAAIAVPLQPQVVAPVVPQVVTPPHVETDVKAATNGTKTKPAAEESNGQFSANPCNSPSAKFLSTCKK